MTANIITALRVVFAALLIPCKSLSAEFYVFYTLAGASDILDGFIARKYGQVSRFGEKFDSVADFVFLIISAAKIFPSLHLPIAIYAWIIFIFILKLTFSAIMRFEKMHSTENKISGVLIFVCVYFVKIVSPMFCAVIICVITTACTVSDYLRRKR